MSKRGPGERHIHRNLGQLPLIRGEDVVVVTGTVEGVQEILLLGAEGAARALLLGEEAHRGGPGGARAAGRVASFSGGGGVCLRSRPAQRPSRGGLAPRQPKSRDGRPARPNDAGSGRRTAKAPRRALGRLPQAPARAPDALPRCQDVKILILYFANEVSRGGARGDASAARPRDDSAPASFAACLKGPKRVRMAKTPHNDRLFGRIGRPISVGRGRRRHMRTMSRCSDHPGPRTGSRAATQAAHPVQPSSRDSPGRRRAAMWSRLVPSSP